LAAKAATQMPLEILRVSTFHFISSHSSIARHIEGIWVVLLLQLLQLLQQGTDD